MRATAVKTDWQEVAERLGEAIPRDRLHPSVLDWVRQNESELTPWHVALSGGADSVAVLLLVWHHWPERRRRLRALHFDHRLRGAASTRDAKFCAALCDALGVSLRLGEWSRGPKDSISEGAARTARMDFFEKHARVIWLGHNQDDVAETVLMRLARGSGAGGLSAPRPVQELPARRFHLRPILSLQKKEILTLLRAAGGTWREDATNPTPDYFRNRVRRTVIPALVAAAQRDAVAGAALSRELLAEDDEALDTWADRLNAVGKSGALLLSRLRGVPRAVVRRVLHRWLLNCRPRIDVSRQAFEGILGAVERGIPTRQSLGRELFAVLKYGKLQLSAGNRPRKFQRRVN